jgi:hypothetical protein
MKVTIPTGWHEVTVSQYQKICEVPKLGFDETDSNLRILSILTGVDDTYFSEVDYKVLKSYYKKISFVSKSPVGLPLRQKVMINGRRYRVNYLASELTAGEYIDVSHWTRTHEETIVNLHKIIACYLKPVNVLGFKKRSCYKKVEGKLIQTAESRDWTAKHLPDCVTMDIIFPMSAFFLNLWQRLINDTKIYLNKVQEKQLAKVRKEMEGLRKTGVGS